MQAAPKALISEQHADQRVLVCIMPSPADLEHARRAGWYRIPVAHAPRGLAATYLAFYQTAAFGQDRWCIRWYAHILAIQIMQRAELLPEQSTHPRATQHYYRIQIGPIAELARPIPSRRLRRLTFIATTWACLNQARDVTELWDAYKAEQNTDQIWGAGIGRRSLR
jgi:hypothetical protein